MKSSYIWFVLSNLYPSCCSSIRKTAELFSVWKCSRLSYPHDLFWGWGRSFSEFHCCTFVKQVYCFSLLYCENKTEISISTTRYEDQGFLCLSPSWLLEYKAGSHYAHFISNKSAWFSLFRNKLAQKSTLKVASKFIYKVDARDSNGQQAGLWCFLWWEKVGRFRIGKFKYKRVQYVKV